MISSYIPFSISGLNSDCIVNFHLEMDSASLAVEGLDRISAKKYLWLKNALLTLTRHRMCIRERKWMTNG